MPEIVVEFVPDYSKLQTGLDQLASSGAIKTELADLFKGAVKPLDDLVRKTGTGSKAVGRDLDQMRQKIKALSKDMTDGFKQGVGDALKEAGVSMEEFLTALNKVGGGNKTLKQQLKETKEQLAQLAVEGKHNTDQYRQLIATAGNLQDALADVAAETRRVGSDTRKIDTAIEIVQGLGAAYQIAQAGAALLGSENETLQRGLLRLQAIMAITNGVQQIANLLQKESNALKLISTIQTKAETAATSLQTAAQSRNIVVSTIATGAMKALNLVMKANPALLLVSAFTLLAGALSLFGRRNKQAADEAALLTAELERQNRAMQDGIAAIDLRTKMNIERAKREGASEQQLNNITLAGLIKQKLEYQNTLAEREKQSSNYYSAEGFRLDVYVKNYDDALKEVNSIDKKLAEDLKKSDRKKLENTKTFLGSLIESYKNVSDAQNAINLQILQNQATGADRQRQEAKAAADKQKADAEKAAEELRKIELQRLTDIKTVIETRLLTEKKGTEQFLQLQIDLARAEKNIGIFNAKSLAEKEFAIANFLDKVGTLTNDFYDQQDKDALERQVSVLNAELENINISAQERERLSVELLNKQRALELQAAIDNGEKQKEINAKFDAEIAAKRLQIRQKELDDEIRLTTAQGGARTRALQAIANDEKKGVQQRIDALDELANAELDNIDKRRAALEKNHADSLISEKDYQASVAELDDQTLQIYENVERQKTDIHSREAQNRIDQNKRELEQFLSDAQAVANVFAGLFQNISDRESQQLQDRRTQLQDLLDAGTISEKEFKARSKRLEADERLARRRAAQREKEMQLFQAFIAGARAIIEAAPDPFRIAFTTALVAAQIALIATKPIPKFGKGAKRAPKGLAEVAETAPEIISNPETGEYYLASHPQVIWLKGGERIYNPKETESIMKAVTPNPQADLMNGATGGATLGINEERLAKKIGDEIAKHPRSVINLDEDGFTHHLNEKNSSTLYRNKRYTFNA